MPFFAKTQVRPNSTTKLWGWQLDSGPVWHIGNGSTSAFYLSADFGKRVAYVGSTPALKLPTLDSTWFELTPGSHTVANDECYSSGNSVVLKYYERWL